MELQRAMGVNQSWLSKLIGRLRDAGWISVTTPKRGSGRCLVMTTKRGKEVLAGFRAEKPASRRTGRKKSTRRSDESPGYRQLDFDLQPGPETWD